MASPMKEPDTSATPWWAVQPTRLPATVRRRRVARAVTAVLCASAIVAIFLAAAANPGRQPRSLLFGGTEYPPSLDALAAGCTGVMSFPVPVDVGWSPGGVGAEQTWNTSPPVGGNFSPTPAQQRFYPPRSVTAPSPADAVASLYRGYIVVWYSQEEEETTLPALREWASTVDPQVRLIVAPWPFPDSQGWPSNRKVIATAWGMKQSCQDYSPFVLESFLAGVTPTAAPGYRVPLDVPGPVARVSTLPVGSG